MQGNSNSNKEMNEMGNGGGGPFSDTKLAIWRKLRQLPAAEWFEAKNRDLLETAILIMHDTQATAEQGGLNKVCEILYRLFEQGQKTICEFIESANKDIEDYYNKFTSDQVRADNLNELWLEQLGHLKLYSYHIVPPDKDPRKWKGRHIRLEFSNYLTLATKYTQVYGPGPLDGYFINDNAILIRLDAIASCARASVIARALLQYWECVKEEYLPKQLQPQGEQSRTSGPAKKAINELKPPFTQNLLSKGLWTHFGLLKYDAARLARHYGPYAGYEKGTQEYKAFRGQLGKVKGDYANDSHTWKGLGEVIKWIEGKPEPPDE